MAEFLSTIPVSPGKPNIAAVVIDQLNHTNWAADLKTQMLDVNIFCSEMDRCGIVIFPHGACISILLHGFKMELKWSPGVSASGESNLL